MTSQTLLTMRRIWLERCCVKEDRPCTGIVVMPPGRGGKMLTAADLQVFTETEWTDLQHNLGLSRRQAQIIERLLCGRSDKQIAKELEVSVPTVRTHLGRLFMRFGVADRCELILHMFTRFREQCRRIDCPRCV